MEAKQVKSLMEAYASVYEGYGKKKKGDCVSKSEKGDHNCAKKVCHEQYGEGECIFGQHAVPDENGFVSHYDVQFEHGIVENVSVEDMEVITMVEHPEHVEHEGETISEMDERSPEYNRRKQEAAKAAAQKQREARRTPITAGGGAPEESGQVDRYRQMARERARKNQNNMESADLFDIVKGHLLDEGYADTEESALAIMANMSEEWRNEIVESMASANRMKEIKERGFERPARSREFEKRLPKERGSRGPEFEHGSTRSSDKPSGNLSANRGGGKGGARSREFEHGSTRSRNTPSANLGDGMPRDKKGNIMY